MTISGNFEHSQYCNFETDFLESENIFQKTGVAFLVENAKIENTLFQYKTTMSEANVKTNRMMSAKCTYDPNAHIRTFCKRWSFI